MDPEVGFSWFSTQKIAHRRGYMGRAHSRSIDNRDCRPRSHTHRPRVILPLQTITNLPKHLPREVLLRVGKEEFEVQRRLLAEERQAAATSAQGYLLLRERSQGWRKAL